MKQVFDLIRLVAKDRFLLLCYCLALGMILWGANASIPLLRNMAHGLSGYQYRIIGFLLGFLLLVIMPAAYIRYVQKHDLRDYGFRLRLNNSSDKIDLLLIIVIGTPLYFFASKDPEIAAFFPFEKIDLAGQFYVYQIFYLLFFATIEAVFRGYLLFGGMRYLSRNGFSDENAAAGAMIFSLLPYSAWHLASPQMTVWGTLVWGVVAAAIALKSGSIIYLTLCHWFMNLIMEWCIWNAANVARPILP
jgi:Type II CAAX prenyl endopeptidase Rce1-like